MAGKKEKKRRRKRIKDSMSAEAGRRKPKTLGEQYPLLADGRGELPSALANG